ncbi:non-reducing end alpha-L-arabinofuranosidase BoGH43A [Aspergillus lentulus]|nr:non-reducing end alpha-L-arabinofuranosidase BoGH43A [Aspergillus lentulus]
MSSINPIVPGFAPDPSVVKVDGWFFLINSSFHLFPGLPIYASQDLISWRHIGNAINRQSQLSLSKSETDLHPLPTGEVLVATGGLYAPTIRYQDGIFYVVCTNVVRTATGDSRQNFVISAKDIWANNWSDPVYFEFNGIDPSLFFDDDGKTYIQGSAASDPLTTINMFEIDLRSGRKLSEERTIWRGTGGIYPEGPHLYKRKGYYYLIIAEGGTHEGHMVTMARSTHIWGPYEGCPNNPILTARDTDEYIQYTGHCDVFQDDRDQWWCTCLGVRKDKNGRYIMGRETFLTQGSWDGDWLSLEKVELIPRGLLASDEGKKLIANPGLDYVYIRDANLSNYTLPSSTGDYLTLSASTAGLSHPELSPTFVGKRQRQLHGLSSVNLEAVQPTWGAAKLRAGMACYKDEHRFLRVYYDATDLAIVTEIINKPKEICRQERQTLESLPKSVVFRMQYTEQEYRLFYTVGDAVQSNWTCASTIDTLDLTGPDFTGPVIGVFAVAETADTAVQFGNLTIC